MLEISFELEGCNCYHWSEAVKGDDVILPDSAMIVRIVWDIRDTRTDLMPRAEWRGFPPSHCSKDSSFY